jgi:hypothetical protein
MKRKTLRKAAGSPIASAQPAPKTYEPTERERRAVQRVTDRRNQRSPAPKFKVIDHGGSVAIKADHPEPACNSILLADILGTDNSVFAEGMLNQIANAARTGKVLKAQELNFMLATVHAIGPRDSTEALLATQMAAIHNAAIDAARRLRHVDSIPQQDSASNMLNKLARTFAAQVEALKRYRASGEQKVTVQHVSVSANQAMVGINQGGGGSHEKSSRSHAPSQTSQSGSALLSHEQEIPMPLPGTSSEGPAGVPHAWGAGWSAKGEA